MARAYCGRVSQITAPGPWMAEYAEDGVEANFYLVPLVAWALIPDGGAYGSCSLVGLVVDPDNERYIRPADEIADFRGYFNAPPDLEDEP